MRGLAITTALMLGTTPLVGQGPGGLEELGFMAGCWQGRSASGSTIEEQYTAPSQNLILGTTRYLRGGVTRSFEFTVIAVDSTGSRLSPHPGGRAGVSFLEAARAPGRLTWENPAHDFPQRIIYHRFSTDSMSARIERMDGSGATEYRMGKIGCAG